MLLFGVDYNLALVGLALLIIIINQKMRNLTMKSPHQKPAVQNSFKRSDRKYPDPKPLN